MTSSALDSLLARLTAGDSAAVAQVFTAYEPYLRAIVRRQLSVPLRAKFDSGDIVQSVWVDVLAGFRRDRWRFRDADHLRAFLAKATRNRFVDRLRQHGRSLAREQTLPSGAIDRVAVARVAPVSQTVRAEELWDQMLAICPPAHRALLEAKRQGKSLDEIAALIGLHPSSVRRILYDIARRLAARRLIAGSVADRRDSEVGA